MLARALEGREGPLDAESAVTSLLAAASPEAGADRGS